ncbi:VWA domain-containing protein [Nocardiopsis sp. CT-R113]|uniref:VWA domain-containing protein n=1 Tax=Nocardiopsis codii TaxID=3065942 RepID=A0ABU7K6K4_9ACTN|nr:VWA domain-containing protein [Nocardiopsis sp. CT-R113]MEE2037881.1 VWA domain-containing protein [Nocardiopsis sp. CT-R113]
MRFRYREYAGGPDPLEGPGPSAGEDASDGVAAALRERLARLAHGVGPTSGAEHLEATALEGALLRYEEGDPTALDGLDPDASGPPDGWPGAGSSAEEAPGGGAAPDGGPREGRADVGAPARGWGPRELRRLGELALRDIEAVRRVRGHLGGDLRGGAGPGGGPTGGHLPRAEGGDRALDAVATVREAALRRARPGERDVVLRPEDVRVAETEPAEAAAVALLVDLSHSMTTRSLHEAATGTALALHTLVRVRRPQDRLRLVGFADRARVMTPAELAAHDWSRVPGTNLHHALRLARIHLRRHRDLRPQVMVVTDGEPTAHLGEDGGARFSWPPDPRTEELTLAELDAALREGAEVAFFVLADDPRLRAFLERVERRRGVRVERAGAGELGPLVVDRYLRRPG